MHLFEEPLCKESFLSISCAVSHIVLFDFRYRVFLFGMTLPDIINRFSWFSFCELWYLLVLEIFHDLLTKFDEMAFL